MEEGEFICPKCGQNGMANYLKWSKKGEKWIFFKKDKGWEYKADFYTDHDDNQFFQLKYIDDVKKCWELYDGERKNHYIFPSGLGMAWNCYSCQYQSRSFLDFIQQK